MILIKMIYIKKCQHLSFFNESFYKNHRGSDLMKIVPKTMNISIFEVINMTRGGETPVQEQLLMKKKTVRGNRAAQSRAEYQFPGACARLVCRLVWSEKFVRQFSQFLICSWSYNLTRNHLKIGVRDFFIYFFCFFFDFLIIFDFYDILIFYRFFIIF